MLRPEISAGAPRRFATAFKLALVAAFLFLTGGPAVIAQFDDGNASFWMQERARTQRQRAQTVVQRPTHLIRRAAPRKGFTVEVPAATPGEVDPNAPLGPDGLPVAATPDGAADWDAEMSLFRQRVSRPNQLETLRRLEARVETGAVLHAADGLAIVSGLDNDAPVGTVLGFAGGARG